MSNTKIEKKCPKRVFWLLIPAVRFYLEMFYVFFAHFMFALYFIFVKMKAELYVRRPGSMYVCNGLRAAVSYMLMWMLLHVKIVGAICK